MVNSTKLKQYLKFGLLCTLSGGFLYAGYVFAGAQDATHLSQVAENITGAFTNLAKMTSGAAYVIGMILALIAFMKFKAHKDNPQSTPLGTPMTFLVLAACLLFTPTLFKVAGQTLFGSGASIGKPTGFESF